MYRTHYTPLRVFYLFRRYSTWILTLVFPLNFFFDPIYQRNSTSTWTRCFVLPLRLLKTQKHSSWLSHLCVRSLLWPNAVSTQVTSGLRKYAIPSLLKKIELKFQHSISETRETSESQVWRVRTVTKHDHLIFDTDSLIKLNVKTHR